MEFKNIVKEDLSFLIDGWKLNMPDDFSFGSDVFDYLNKSYSKIKKPRLKKRNKCNKLIWLNQNR